MRLSAHFAACLAWLSLALFSFAAPSLTLAPSQAQLSERHVSSHAVFLEDACESSEENESSDHELLAPSFLASVASSCSPRFIESSTDVTVATAVSHHGLSVLRDVTARGPPTSA